jgi:AcrR family transcriptional regulator
VRRTRKLLREALLELVEERGFERVTVKAITERAMVSRAAFYRAHWSKYDLVQQIFDEAMDTLSSTLPEDPDATPRERWAGFFGHVARYDRLYRAAGPAPPLALPRGSSGEKSARGVTRGACGVRRRRAGSRHAYQDDLTHARGRGRRGHGTGGLRPGA